MSKILLRSALILVVGCGVACEGGSLKNRDIGAITGTALGAGLGAIIGHQVGNTGGGIAIGSGIGAITGGVLGHESDKSQRRLDESEQAISAQQRQLEENKRLIDELKAAGADARGTDRGVVVNLPDVLFEFDSARLTGAAKGTVAEIARIARGVEGREISVEGHTDSVGTVEYNQRLSEDRARTVADGLVGSGVSRRRISVRGFGESDPVASNASVSGRQQNRRVEVIILNR